MKYDKELLIYFQNTPPVEEREKLNALIHNYFIENKGEVLKIEEKKGSWVIDIYGFISNNPTSSFFVSSIAAGFIGWGVSKLGDYVIKQVNSDNNKIKHQEKQIQCSSSSDNRVFTKFTQSKQFLVSERTYIPQHNGSMRCEERIFISRKQEIKEYSCISSNINDVNNFREQIVREYFPNLKIPENKHRN